MRSGLGIVQDEVFFRPLTKVNSNRAEVTLFRRLFQIIGLAVGKAQPSMAQSLTDGSIVFVIFVLLQFNGMEMV